MNDQPKSRGEIHLDLAAETLLQFSEVRFVAHGSSMLPAIFPGDCLTVQSFSDVGPRVGNVVLVRRANDFLVHRVVRILNDQLQSVYILRGDSLTQDDPPVSRIEILGRVTSLNRAGKSLQVSSQSTPAQRALRLFVRHSSFAVALLLRWNIFRSQRSKRENPSQAIPCNTRTEYT